MPSYDYRCTDCKEAFTVERSMNDTSKTMCTECGSEKVSRLWSVPMKRVAHQRRAARNHHPRKVLAVAAVAAVHAVVASYRRGRQATMLFRTRPLRAAQVLVSLPERSLWRNHI